jgi:crotonobetainyl-CoA:carnitine CoA-transferase CaiB-like acyl-CoA transferase
VADVTIDGAAGASTAGQSSELPLTGVRIIDLTQVAAGPYGTSLLGDFGADVIKVEPPSGDTMRHVDEGFGVGQSAYFFGVNRSKRCMVLDLKAPAGYDVLKRLLSDADVCVVAMRPEALKRMRLDYETLREINPRLIYVSITAFGEAGPRVHQPGMDILAQAMSGLMGITGEEGRSPVKVGAPIGDFVNSFLLGFGVTAALRLRDRTGRGDHISINLLDGLVSVFANILTPFDRNKKPVKRLGGGHPQLVPYQPFFDVDGKYFVLACMGDKFWQKLLPMLDEFDDFDDARYSTNTGRVEFRDELCDRLQEIFRLRPAAYWLERLETAGVPCGPIHDLEDMLAEPQIIANKSVVELVHPQHGRYIVPNNPIRFEGAATGPRGYAPALGQHTFEVLAEVGYTHEEIDGLRSEGVIVADTTHAEVRPVAEEVSTT